MKKVYWLSALLIACIVLSGVGLSGCLGGILSGAPGANATASPSVTPTIKTSVNTSFDPDTPVCPPGYTEVTSIDGTIHCKGPDGYIYDLALPGETPVRSANRYQWLGDHPPGSTATPTPTPTPTPGPVITVPASGSWVNMPVSNYETVEPRASADIPAAILAKMRPPNLDWVPPEYTSTALPAPALIIEPGQSLSLINDVAIGDLVIVRGDHSSETLTIRKPMILKGEDCALVRGIDIEAPCIVTGFSVTGRECGIFAQGISGTPEFPFIIEGNHCYRNGYGLRLYYCDNALIKNNYFESNSEVELHVEHLNNCTFTGNDLGEAMYHPGEGKVDVDGAALRYLNNCVFEKNYIGEHYYGTRWYSCKDCIIRDNVYRNSGSNIRLGKDQDNGNFGRCERMQVIGNDIRGGTDGIWAQACIDSVFNDNIIRAKYPFPSGYGQGGSGSGNDVEVVIPSYD
ncbi:right-handed parallel beta-helix repeat-containing protein [Methanocella arvoryzae]|uniref:right-handed parallel beta-helix repeat-containing protein n=1 Tax=Methanocella arvoryzae TaxID=1175445 RepID=UPI0011D22EDD|nr:right-handed parallel beta-helix repeat-containing protein [Methanocella arvoryzae]